jgi:HTH-type transcriptional regulator/antitoxin MqsA
MSKMRTQPCPECGGEMRYETRPEILSYKGCERAIQTLGWWCSKCGEGILSGEPLASQEKAFLELKAEVDDVLSPAQVAAVRVKLKLSQRKAGELLGGGPRSFQKYESGKQAVSTPMSHLLRLLDNDVSRLEEVIGSKMGKGHHKGIVSSAKGKAVGRLKDGRIESKARSANSAGSLRVGKIMAKSIAGPKARKIRSAG